MSFDQKHNESKNPSSIPSLTGSSSSLANSQRLLHLDNQLTITPNLPMEIKTPDTPFIPSNSPTPWTPTPLTPQLSKIIKGGSLPQSSQFFAADVTKAYLSDAKHHLTQIIGNNDIKESSLLLLRAMSSLQQYARITETFELKGVSMKAIPAQNIQDIKESASKEFINTQRNFQQNFRREAQLKKHELLTACLTNKFLSTLVVQKFERIWHYFITVYIDSNGLPMHTELSAIVGSTQMEQDIANVLSKAFDDIRVHLWDKTKNLLEREYGIHPAAPIYHLIKLQPIDSDKLRNTIKHYLHLLAPTAFTHPFFNDFRRLIKAISHNEISINILQARGFTSPQKLVRQCKVLHSVYDDLFLQNSIAEQNEISPIQLFNDDHFLPCLQALVNEPEIILSSRIQNFDFKLPNSIYSTPLLRSHPIPTLAVPTSATEQLQIWGQEYLNRSKQHLLELVDHAKFHKDKPETAYELYLFNCHVFDLMSCLNYYYTINLRSLNNQHEDKSLGCQNSDVLINGIFELFQELTMDEQEVLTSYFKTPWYTGFLHDISHHTDIRYGSYVEQLNMISHAIRKNTIINFVMRHFMHWSLKNRKLLIKILTDNTAPIIYSLLRKQKTDLYMNPQQLSRLSFPNNPAIIVDFAATFPDVVKVSLEGERRFALNTRVSAFIDKNFGQNIPRIKNFMNERDGIRHMDELLQRNTVWFNRPDAGEKEKNILTFFESITKTSREANYESIKKDFDATFAEEIQQQQEEKISQETPSHSSFPQYHQRVKQDLASNEPLLGNLSTCWESLDEKNDGAFIKLKKEPFDEPLPTPSYLPPRFSHWSSLAEAVLAHPTKTTLAALHTKDSKLAVLPQRRSKATVPQTHDIQGGEIKISLPHTKNIVEASQTSRSNRLYEWYQKRRCALKAIMIGLIIILSTFPPINATVLSFVSVFGLTNLILTGAQAVFSLIILPLIGYLVDCTVRIKNFFDRHPILIGFFLTILIIGTIPSIAELINLPFVWLSSLSQALFIISSVFTATAAFCEIVVAKMQPIFVDNAVLPSSSLPIPTQGGVSSDLWKKNKDFKREHSSSTTFNPATPVDLNSSLRAPNSNFVEASQSTSSTYSG